MNSRRLFLKSGAMTMVSLGFAPTLLTRTAAAADSERRLLVAIFQRGAADGLNVIVPFGDDEYYKLRPSIAIARPGKAEGALDLDGFFGLHPRMAALKPLWDQGVMAVVHACGSHDATRSHVDAQNYMETATPGVKSTRDGWLNRYLQATGEPSALRGVAVAPQLPRVLQGEAPALALHGGEMLDLEDGSAVDATPVGPVDTLLGLNAREAFDAMRIVRNATAARYQPAAGVEYPHSAFGDAMQDIARLAKSDVGLEVAFVESADWDHHVNEGSTDGHLAGRLDDLSRGIAALTRDLGERIASTVVITMSEFGRSAAENSSRGTDDGHGNAMMLIGGPVKGAHAYGRWPGLRREQRFEARDLAVTTDFRDVLSEIVTRHLGAPPEAIARVFPGFTPGAPLGIIRG